MKKILFMLMAVCCIGITIPLQVKAEDAVQEEELTELNQIMKASKAIKAREMPKASAAVVINYESGAPVFVVGETADGWYKVSYQDKEGYVRKSELTPQELDVDAMDEEMKAAEAESKMVVEEVERYRAEARRSRIWGTIIVLLVVGIFATGIISTIKAEKEKNKKGDNEPGKEEAIIDLDKED